METTGRRGLLRRAGLAALTLVMAAAVSLAPAVAAPERAWAGEPYDVTAPEGAALKQAISKAESFVEWLRTGEGQTAVAENGEVEGVTAGFALYAKWEKVEPEESNLWWGDKYADGTSTGHDASSWDDIESALARHYAGDIDLTDSEKYPGFAVGVTRTVHLSAMDASGSNDYGSWSVGESQAEQDVELVIMNRGGYALTDDAKTAFVQATGKDCRRDKAAFIIGQKDSLKSSGYMNSSATSSGSWEGSARRAWCNSAYRAALPAGLQGMLQEVDVVTAQAYSSTSNQTSQDYCFLPAEYEVFGYSYRSNENESTALTHWAYYANSANCVKKIGSSVTTWWERSPRGPYENGFCAVDFDGSAGGSLADYPRGFAPCGCI